MSEERETEAKSVLAQRWTVERVGHGYAIYDEKYGELFRSVRQVGLQKLADAHNVSVLVQTINEELLAACRDALKCSPQPVNWIQLEKAVAKADSVLVQTAQDKKNLGEPEATS